MPSDDIARLYDFTAGTTIVSDQVDAEFNQLVNTANNKVGRATTETITGTKTFSGNNIHNGNETFNGTNTHAGANTFSGTNTFSGDSTVSGTLNLGRSTNPTWANGIILLNTTVNKPLIRINGTTNELAWRRIICPTLANNGTDANNDIDISTGAIWSDDDLTIMPITSTITKRLDASWAVGTNQGGLDTGTKANNTTYHVWIIHRTDTGVTDVLFSTSASSPTMPTSYDRKRCIGAIITDSSGNIRAFTQYNSYFFLSAPPLDVNTSSLSTSRTSYTLTTPSGVSCIAILNVLATFTAGGVIYVSPLAATDSAASSSAAPLCAIAAGTSSDFSAGQIEVLTNTSSQIGARSTAASTTFRVATVGWIDQRGRE